MKRVKLYYKGQEVGVYDNKKDAQGVVVTRMNATKMYRCLTSISSI